MNLTQLTKPVMEVYGENYTLRWTDGPYITLVDFNAHSNKEITAEIEVYDDAELEPFLYPPTRVTINKSFSTTIRELSEVSARPDWRQRFGQVKKLVLPHYKSGTPIISLGAMDPPEPIREELEGVLWQGLPTVVYGAGGIGKSAICLAWASAVHTGTTVANLKAHQSNVLYLDWETSDRLTYWRNKELLDAKGISHGTWADPERPESGRTGMVFYRYMSGPLWDDLPFLRAEVERLNIGTVCIDSASPACGGEPENAKATDSFFSALRGLSPAHQPVQSIILAHVTHEARKSGKRSSPFGSVFWLNQPRNVFELDSVQEKNATHTDMGLYHVKSNTGPLRSEQGFRLTWGGGHMTVEDLNIREHNKLSKKLADTDRAEIFLLTEGPTPIRDLAEELDLNNHRSLASQLSSDDRFASVNGKWEAVEPLGVNA